MKVYKIRHIPTGLFLKPARYPSKSNFSKKGKVYFSRPNLEWFNNTQSPKNQLGLFYKNELKFYSRDEFEIISYEMKEQ